jgi:hypothetical protein
VELTGKASVFINNLCGEIVFDHWKYVLSLLKVTCLSLPRHRYHIAVISLDFPAF